MTEDEQAAKFKEDVDNLAKTAEKKKHIKEVKKYDEAVKDCEKDGGKCPEYEKKKVAAEKAVKKDEAEDYEKKVEVEAEEKAKKVNSVDVVEAEKKVEKFKKEVVEVERTISAKVADPPKEEHTLPGGDSSVKEKLAKDAAEEEAKADAIDAEKEAAAAAVKKNPAVAASEAAAENFDDKKKVEKEAVEAVAAPKSIAEAVEAVKEKKQRKITNANMNDEEWTANMPGRLLSGVPADLAVQHRAQIEESASESESESESESASESDDDSSSSSTGSD